MTARDQADALLAGIRGRDKELSALHASAQAEAEKATARYKRRIEQAETKRAEMDRDLKRLMKAETAAVFDGRDKVNLKNGVLLHTQDFKVTIPRDALEKIKEQGWAEAVRVAESVDRPVVEAWPDERLVIIGARRRLADKYGYSLSEED